MKSDNDSQFQSKEFKSFLLEHGIEHHASPPLWPQANGEVERQNRTLLKILKVFHMEGKGWKGELVKFMLAYRTTPQVSVGLQNYTTSQYRCDSSISHVRQRAENKVARTSK